MTFIIALALDFLAGIVAHLILLIATRAGAEDLCYMIAQRAQERTLRLATLAHSLGVAAVDRSYWLRDRLSENAAASTLFDVAARGESFVSFAGGGLGTIGGCIFAMRLIGDLTHSPQQMIAADACVIVLGGLVILLVMSLTRRLMELTPENGVRLLVTYSIALAGIAASWLVLANLWLIALAWGGCIAFTLVIGIIEDRARQRRREREQMKGHWSPAFTRRDMERYLKPIRQQQEARRRGVLPLIR